MPKFAANLSMLFTEYEFPKRFVHAAAAGFSGIEYLFPYDYTPAQLKQWLDDQSLPQVLFNLPAGRWDQGERGLACLPDRQTEFQEGVHIAMEYANTLGNELMHCMAGIRPEGLSYTKALDTYLTNLAYATDIAAQHNRAICIEPINPYDMPGYFLQQSEQAVEIINELNRTNLKLQYDIYHAQRVEGHISHTLERFLTYIGHIQIANSPGRHEPHLGEINYDFIFHLVDHLGYAGWIGCEYLPAATTAEGLSWLRRYQPQRTK